MTKKSKKSCGGECSKKKNGCKKSQKIICDDPVVEILPVQESWLTRIYRKLFGSK